MCGFFFVFTQNHPLDSIVYWHVHVAGMDNRLVSTKQVVPDVLS